MTTTDLDHAKRLIEPVCRVAGLPSLIEDFRNELTNHGVLEAIDQHDSAVLFDWLTEAVSYQRISDWIAWAYMQRHGRATWAELQRNLTRPPSCPKLTVFWHFHDCRYHKGSGTCAEPDHLPDCPLPTHRLRNGRLNQTAYGLFLFIRDVAGDDLVSWIDNRLAEGDDPAAPDRLRRLRDSLLVPLRTIYGVSDKVWTMILSGLLLGGGQGRKRWLEVGTSMVVVDTLVHNFLHRTGILERFSAAHPYGPGCYRSNGCADILEQVAQQIDARAFNPAFPAVFPRFVQHAIWRYCAQRGLDICNGNRIDDDAACTNGYCRVYGLCDRLALRSQRQRS
ncbi:MAG: hypothetical protein JO309_01705 [Pseudonocardiales bacterium]|nr:hypothetical protein [Hyphomicrobiales bacterium]MBV8825537.1 hypothetical protein [Hyphomicrobiales bacterium]MBV9429463.1 hypothetical protein [Bradyrhizobiaceae bacterium]MBV9728131.1 hypothetical protein [Pseudonocardiales bacterium]